MKTTLHTAYHGILILRDGNHNYAYGGLIGDLCTGQEEQEFKFGDKKLDRTYGLDLYDFEARQYDAIAPWFTSIDPLAEKYYSISPYAYCAGDPVNLVDPTGEAWCNANGDTISNTGNVKVFIFYSSVFLNRQRFNMMKPLNYMERELLQ